MLLNYYYKVFSFLRANLNAGRDVAETVFVGSEFHAAIVFGKKE